MNIIILSPDLSKQDDSNQSTRLGYPSEYFLFRIAEFDLAQSELARLIASSERRVATDRASDRTDPPLTG